MKFKYLFLGFAALLMTACDKDFDDWGQQAGNEQGSAVTFGNGSVAEVALINFGEIPEDQDSVQVCAITAPTSSYSQTSNKYSITLNATDTGGNSYSETLDLDDEGRVDRVALESFVEKVFGKNPNNTNVMNAVVTAYTGDGKTAVKSVLATSGTFTVSAKTNAPQIAKAYYIVGGPNSNWAASAINRSLKFTHSGKDVYEDPVFTVVFDAVEGEDTWFAIADDEACDGIEAGDWSKLYGVVGGQSDAPSGSLARRADMGGAENSFKVAAGAKKIKVTINMMDCKFNVELVNISDAYYLVGGDLDWAASAKSKEQKFSHSNKDVFEDPVFTYLLNGGKEQWFSFGDADDLDAIDKGDWKQIYGWVGEEAMSGRFDRRTNLDGDHTFHVDGSAPFYLVSINMAEMTYEIKPISPRFYFFGSFNGWDAESAKTALMFPVTSSKFEYTTYASDDGILVKMWQEDGLGDWSKCYNTAKSSDRTKAESGSIEISDGGSMSAPGSGWYTYTFDLSAMSYKWTKIDNQNPTEYEHISLIGEFNRWGGDYDLTKTADGHNWYCTFTQEADGMLKLRANHDWDYGVNWGYGSDGDWTVSDADWAKVCTNNGGNIKLPAGKYRIYINDITNQVSIISVTE